MRVRSSLVTFALLAGAGPGLADTVTLKNGRELHGKLDAESEHEIRLRTAGGTITIPRGVIATFHENDVVYPSVVADGDRALSPPCTGGDAAVELRASAGRGTTTRAGAALSAPAAATWASSAPAASARVAPTRPDWSWAPGLDDATIEELTPLRDAYLAELERLGPSPAERLKKVELDAEERAELNRLMDAFDRRQANVRNQGGRRIRGFNSRNQARRAAATSVAEFGALAIGPLRNKLRSPNALDQRMSAQAVAKAGADEDFTADEVTWYRYHFDVPGALIALLEESREHFSYLVRNDANSALLVVTGHPGFAFELGRGKDATPAEAEAAHQWASWWGSERSRWLQAEAVGEKKRAALLAALEQVRAGKAVSLAEAPRRLGVAE